MVEGVAEYREPGQEPYRIFIGEDAIKNMDPSFQGRPVFVHHVDGVDDNREVVKEQADGYVIRSFFNQTDGKHWCEFIAVTDEALERIRAGWKLSNAYLVKDATSGGQWHGVDYAKKVTRGEYEHLAIVPNPRYAESVILTPEEFKAYNEKKEVELRRLANENKGVFSMFNLFKKEAVKNTAEFESMSVTLPKSKVEKTLLQLVNEADDYNLKMKEPQMANGDHHVMVGEHKMSVNELVEKHMAACNELAEMKKGKEANGDDNLENEEDEKKKKEEAEKKANTEREAAEKKANSDKAAAEKAQADKEAADKLRNADKSKFDDSVTVEVGNEASQRGKSRYGSK